MSLLVNRRGLLLSALTLPALQREDRSPDINQQIFEAVWEAVRDEFYDPNTRGVNWIGVKEEFLPRARACASGGQLLALLREVLGRLRNSHIFLYSREEWALRKNLLPFCFDLAGQSVFVRYGLRRTQSSAEASFEFGDEIISVDGIGAAKLRPVTLARLDEVSGNPNFGPPDSIAGVEIRRRGRLRVLTARRVARPNGFETAVVEHPRPGIAHLRTFTLGSIELPAARLKQLWSKLIDSSGLILDLRNCVGGDSLITNFIAGSLLGPGKPLFRMIPRPGTAGQETVDQSDPEAPRFRGRVALITNSNTESQPEVMAAVCKEYGCARIFGERTAGAFNGWTKAIPLPNSFARFALPYTRSVSPKGIQYEGRGVAPDTVAINTVADFEAKQDRALIAALEYVSV